MDEMDYRMWLKEGISKRTGVSFGEGAKELWSLHTEVLEKLYMAMTGSSPRRDYSHFKEARGG